MRHPSTTSLTWRLALALTCALIVPVSVSLAEEAEEAGGDENKAEETQEQAEPGTVLRVEEGRTMTNQQAGAQTPVAVNAKKQKVDIPEGQVFTNALLDRLFGATEDGETAAGSGSPATAPPGTATPAPDPLKAMQEGVAERNQRDRLIQEAQKEVEAAKARLAKLEVQLLATSNPFSARPALSDEEKEVRANSGESAQARRDRTAKLVEEARTEVKAAEDKLALLRSGS